jgi:2,5-diamino-6-(ribosylamino)-4(3H)-pyrimidinone 5'-phosphate reductase
MPRPTVVTCNVISVDGRLTLAPGVQLLEGDERWSALMGGSDPYAWAREVHDPQVLLEGSGSFVASDATPVSYTEAHEANEAHEAHEVSNVPKDHHLPADLVSVPGRRWMTVVDGRGRVQLQFTEWPDPQWAGWHVLVLTSTAVAPGHLDWLRRSGIPYLVAGEGPVDLGLALQLLHERLGVETVVATGGGRLGGALLRAGLVDEVDVEILPAAIGGRGTPALFDGTPLLRHQWPTRLRLVSSDVTDEGHVRLRYAVVRD